MTSSQTGMHGFDELEKVFASLADPEAMNKIGTQVGGRIMRRKVLPAIKEALPVGTRPTLRKRKRKNGTVAEADYGRVTTNLATKKIRKAPGQTALVWTVSTNHAFWWWMNEFGTVDQPANPVIRVTWARVAPDLPAEIGLGLWAGVERLAKKRGVDIGGGGD